MIACIRTIPLMLVTGLLGGLILHGCAPVMSMSKEEVSRYRKAAEQGDPIAQSKLSQVYHFGLGGEEKNPVEEEKWRRKSAEQGYPESQYNLGYMYEIGYVVPKSDAEAAKWYRKAAAQGYHKALRNLGAMVARERKDKVSVVVWYTLAAEQGDKEAASILRRQLARFPLTTSQKAEVDKRADEWRKQYRSK